MNSKTELETFNKINNWQTPLYVKGVIGGLGGMGASLITQPIDLLKSRMQLSGELGSKRDHRNSFQAIRNIVRKEGASALYCGLSANLFRQATYTSTRLGIYQAAVEEISRAGYPELPSRIIAALTAGFFGAVFSTPADVLITIMQLNGSNNKIYPSNTAASIVPVFVTHKTLQYEELKGAHKIPKVALVRMTADGRLPLKERRNYRNVFVALHRIGCEEGISGLWKGVEPTILRALVSNVAQLVTYTQTKQYILKKGYAEDNISCHFVSSLVAGFAYAGASNPLDMAKTRIQTMKAADGKPIYSGLFDVWKKTIVKEGFPALWKGFGPYYARVAPHTILLFIFCEQLTILYKNCAMNSKSASSL